METLFRKGIAPSTERMYGVARRRYLGFCGKYGWPPLPVSEKLLCQFVAFLAGEGLMHSSIKAYLEAVRQLQVEAGRGDPGLGKMPKLGQVVRGVQRWRSEQGRRQRQRKPMTVEVLEVLRTSWSVTPGGIDAKMLWAAATLAFFGFMRSGELTIPSTRGFNPYVHLTWQDVANDNTANSTVVKVCLKASQTDQLRQGCTLVVGRTGDKLCPVAAVLGFMAVVGRRLGPLFQYASGKPLTQAGFVVELKSALEQRGVCSQEYSGHSFRIGAATTATGAGVGDAVIQQLGRWRSAAYKGYVQPERESLAGIPQQMVAGRLTEKNSRARQHDGDGRGRGNLETWTENISNVNWLS